MQGVPAYSPQLPSQTGLGRSVTHLPRVCFQGTKANRKLYFIWTIKHSVCVAHTQWLKNSPGVVSTPVKAHAFGPLWNQCAVSWLCYWLWDAGVPARFFFSSRGSGRLIVAGLCSACPLVPKLSDIHQLALEQNYLVEIYMDSHIGVLTGSREFLITFYKRPSCS